MPFVLFRCAVVLILGISASHAAERSVRVFVALCDNQTQGIVPVGERIGNGDDPEANLYWGCDDGLASWFRRSSRWKLLESSRDVSPQLLRRLTFTHVTGDLRLVADAYRGSAMKQCLEAFEAAAASGDHDLVAYLGHNGLMDFSLPVPERPPGPPRQPPTDAVVLGCLSGKYFAPRLDQLGCRPVLLTSQLMYPGAFLLHDALESWRSGGSRADIRDAAGRAYARNQGLSVRAATSVFATLE